MKRQSPEGEGGGLGVWDGGAEQNDRRRCSEFFKKIIKIKQEYIILVLKKKNNMFSWDNTSYKNQNFQWGQWPTLYLRPYNESSFDDFWPNFKS